MMNYIKHHNPKTTFNSFGVTLTLDPYFCSMYNHIEQYEILVPQILQDIALFPTQIEQVYISFELTANNNIHVHLAVETGFLLKLSVARELFNLVFSTKSIYGFNKTVPLYNHFGWLDYINKGQYYQEHYAYAF